MDLLVIGLSHKTAPLALRERLAVAAGELEAELRALVALPGLREAALISTCNRVEVYGAYSDPQAALAALRARLRSRARAAGGGRPGSGEGGEGDDGGGELGGRLYERVGREAVHHLFRLSASLDSMVVGEPQILGQLKEAHELAARAGTSGPLLAQVFTRAFRVARRVRRETGIARQPVSVSSVAVDLAREFWEGFRGRRVLLVGAGKMADLAARALAAQGARVAVANRTLARAEELAGRLGAEVEPWERLGDALGRADIVITSTGAREPVLGRSLVAEACRARRGRPLVLIDIAVPRDVDPAVRDLHDVFLYDIDYLQQRAARNLEGRRGEADRAEALVEEEVGRFVALERGRAVGPTIAALRARCLAVARAEAEKTIAGLGAIDERGRRAVLAMAEAIVAKLMHAPSVALKKGATGGDGDELVAAVERLFELGPPEPVPARPVDAGAGEAPAAGAGGAPAEAEGTGAGAAAKKAAGS
jgi:glutamyl-tRNA reductase